MHRTDYGNIKIVLRTPPNVTSDSMRESDADTLLEALRATGLVEGASISWLRVEGVSFNMPVPEWAVEDGPEDYVDPHDGQDVPDPNQPGVGGHDIEGGDVRVCKYCRFAIVRMATPERPWVHQVTHDGRTLVQACEADMQSMVATPEDDDAVTPELHPGTVLAHIHTDSTGQFVGPLEKDPTMFVYENRKGNIFKGHYNQWKVV